MSASPSKDDFIFALYPLARNTYEVFLMYSLCEENWNAFYRATSVSRNQQYDGSQSANVLSRQPDTEPDWRDTEHLRFPWDLQRKRRIGLSIGGDTSCDIVISNDKFKGNEVSGFHGVFFFDDQYRLVYRDMRDPSKPGNGSTVTFNGMGGQARRGYSWILSGTPFLRARVTEIIVQIHHSLRFRVHVPPYDNTSPEFQRWVDDHRARYIDQGVEEHFGQGLFLSNNGGSKTTALATTARTLSTDPIHIADGVLGQGGFGLVTKTYNVSTGQIFARKTPRGDLMPSTQLLWRREIETMQRVNVASEMSDMARARSFHVIKMLFGSMDPNPVLDLEYAPLGSLDDQMHKSRLLYGEIVSALEQVLKALAFLHGPTLNMAHRDIKPPNVLVMARACRGSDGSLPSEAVAAATICVKLADFGLAKDDDLVTMFCGTSIYMAPEQFQTSPNTANGRMMYTTSVDIWATGVMVYELFYGRANFPEPPSWSPRIVSWTSPASPQQAFCWAVRDIICHTQGAHEAVVFAGKSMVCMNPKDRFSAEDCLEWFAPMAKSGTVNGNDLSGVTGQTPGMALNSNLNSNTTMAMKVGAAAVWAAKDESPPRQSHRTAKRTLASVKTNGAGSGSDSDNSDSSGRKPPPRSRMRHDVDISGQHQASRSSRPEVVGHGSDIYTGDAYARNRQSSQPDPATQVYISVQATAAHDFHNASASASASRLLPKRSLLKSSRGTK